MLAAAFFWGTSATLARFVFHDRHVPPLVAVELRLAISVAILAPWLAWRRPAALRIRREDLGYFVVLGLFGVAAVQGTYYYAIGSLGVGLAILIQYIAPALIVGYETLRGAPLRARAVLAVVAALVGTACLVVGVDRASFGASPLGWAAGFGSALSFAFYVVYSKRGLARYAPETVLFYTFLVAGIFWACVTPPTRIIAAGYDRTLWSMFVALGIFSTLVPFALFSAGLRRLSPGEAGVLATTEPVVAVLSAAILLGEGLRAQQWLGAALVLCAALLATLRAPASLP
ncbi:MAG: EamA family transporter [Candidatus Eisenbacteria bacterium]|uniref:EamA family transporter n=1 Tax=Eiseniibacteriota bacterium TaxID=2212470 RepID=A0A9D6LBX0_UNCEI|nr:EamA family transporter [Candidatus Eisenbacteria bacterium]MBI3540303.1 EamA family transporter [Candidatus Eisenbacteria bacterium]